MDRESTPGHGRRADLAEQPPAPVLHTPRCCHNAHSAFMLTHIRSSVLKTWPKWLRVLSLALASTTLTLFYLEPLRKNISKLQKAQNLLARVVTCSPQSCSPRILLQQLHWFPIKHRINFKIANITFCTLHCSQPAYLRSSLHACHSTRSLRLSNTNLLSAPFVRTSFSSRSFSVAAPKIWNSLPLSLRNCTSPDTFRRHLKTHYCQQAFLST